MGVKQNLSLLGEYFKISLASAMEYRFSFFTQVITMFLNDAMWLVFWLLFFQRFPIINGWAIKDFLMLHAILTVSFGITAFVFGNRNRLADIIAEGRLDFYLTLPKNSLWHVLISRSSPFGLGDVLYGLLVGVFAFDLSQVPLFILFSLLGVVTFIAFGIIVGSLGFYWGHAKETSRNLFMGLVSFAAYPFPIFHGFVKLILLTLIPAGFITGIPLQILQDFNLKWLIISILVPFIFLGIAILVYSHGLKKYESGNTMNVRL
jgi:ABC-2 type transport system permease protein